MLKRCIKWFCWHFSFFKIQPLTPLKVQKTRNFSWNFTPKWWQRLHFLHISQGNDLKLRLQIDVNGSTFWVHWLHNWVPHLCHRLHNLVPNWCHRHHNLVPNQRHRHHYLVPNRRQQLHNLVPNHNHKNQSNHCATVIFLILSFQHIRGSWKLRKT